jgi:hypothetical protein
LVRLAIFRTVSSRESLQTTPAYENKYCDESRIMSCHLLSISQVLFVPYASRIKADNTLPQLPVAAINRPIPPR